MEMTEAYNTNLTITSDCPIANVYNTLSEGRLIKTEMPDVSVDHMPPERGYSSEVNTEPAANLSDGQPMAEMSHVFVNDMPHEHESYRLVIRTDPIDSTLSEAQLVKSDISGNSTRHDLSVHSCVLKKYEQTDLIKNQGNPIPRVNETRDYLLSGKDVGHKPFGCYVWDKKFSKPYFLTLDKRADSEEKPFVCDICDERFSSSSCLIEHGRLHTPENPYVCDFCGKRFAFASNLVIHKRYHTGEKPFICEFCNKGFVHTGDLLRHRRSHTGEKPFMCDYCGKFFSNSYNLTQHKHSHTGAKNFVCDICNKSYSLRSGLTRHKRSHTREKAFASDSCDKSSPKASDLARHKQSQTGEKPFVCDFCERRFVRSSNLIKHQRSHTGEKPILQSLPSSETTPPEFGTRVPVESMSSDGH